MNQSIQIANPVDSRVLESKIKAMYREVAEHPTGDFHFEMGRALAERLGYPAEVLDLLPAEAISSFAGVGYYFHLAKLKPDEHVLDLGSGSGMDAFFASTQIGATGEVFGVDMTPEQLHKSAALAKRDYFDRVHFLEGYIERLPVVRGSFDVVISNGVINLSAEKANVFSQAARVLKPGGRLAIADIVSEKALPEKISCNVNLWAACIGGAMQQDQYCALIEAAGFRIEAMQDNRMYAFLSKSARSAGQDYGVKSVSLLAVKR